MIPVFEPVIGEEEISAVVAALKRGEISGSFGQAITDFEKSFAEYTGCKYGVAVSSGSTALQLAVQAAEIGRGDEVLMSATTNIATALAAYHRGAVSISVDSEAETWNLNLDLIESLITPKTKAILPVHLYGHPVDMEKLCTIAKKHKLTVIEDCAESHGATVRGKMTGSFGDMACFSFYANKVITTGEGGMVTTNSLELAEKLRLLRNLAFTEPRFRHIEPGYNFRMTGYQAAMGVEQTKKIEKIIAEKRRVAQTYNKFLEGTPGLQTPVEKSWARNVYWMYAVTVEPKNGKNRTQVLDHLKKNGVDTRTFFCPMNMQPCLEDLPGFRKISCPVSEKLWETGFYLPSTHTLEEKTIKTITDILKAALRT